MLSRLSLNRGRAGPPSWSSQHEVIQQIGKRRAATVTPSSVQWGQSESASRPGWWTWAKRPHGAGTVPGAPLLEPSARFAVDRPLNRPGGCRCKAANKGLSSSSGLGRVCCSSQGQTCGDKGPTACASYCSMRTCCGSLPSLPVLACRLSTMPAPPPLRESPVPPRRVEVAQTPDLLISDHPALRDPTGRNQPTSECGRVGNSICRWYGRVHCGREF